MKQRQSQEKCQMPKSWINVPVAIVQNNVKSRVHRVVAPDLEVGIDHRQPNDDAIHSLHLLVSEADLLAEAGHLVDGDPYLKGGSRYLQEDVGHRRHVNEGLLHPSVSLLEDVVLSPKSSRLLLKRGENHLEGAPLKTHHDQARHLQRIRHRLHNQADTIVLRETAHPRTVRHRNHVDLHVVSRQHVLKDTLVVVAVVPVTKDVGVGFAVDRQVHRPDVHQCRQGVEMHHQDTTGEQFHRADDLHLAEIDLVRLGSASHPIDVMILVGNVVRLFQPVVLQIDRRRKKELDQWAITEVVDSIRHKKITDDSLLRPLPEVALLKSLKPKSVGHLAHLLTMVHQQLNKDREAQQDVSVIWEWLVEVEILRRPGEKNLLQKEAGLRPSSGVKQAQLNLHHRWQNAIGRRRHRRRIMRHRLPADQCQRMQNRKVCDRETVIDARG
jgi:hypothetical protein